MSEFEGIADVHAQLPDWDDRQMICANRPRIAGPILALAGAMSLAAPAHATKPEPAGGLIMRSASLAVRLGLELGAQGKSQFHIEENDPLSAVAELRRTQTISRDNWQIRIETQMRLSCTADTFLLQGDLRAFEGANEVCHRIWDRSIPRDFI
jgi:hypothetical protein